MGAGNAADVVEDGHDPAAIVPTKTCNEHMCINCTWMWYWQEECGLVGGLVGTCWKQQHPWVTSMAKQARSCLT